MSASSRFRASPGSAAFPEESGRLAVFLASNEADHVTGSAYYIDGGLMQSAGQGA